MQLKSLSRPSRNSLIGTPLSKHLSISPSTAPLSLAVTHFLLHEPNPPLKLRFSKSPTRYNTHILSCKSPKNELIGKTTEIVFENGSESISISAQNEGQKEVAEAKSERLADQSVWDQMSEIVKFSGPATGLWICGPLMSLIDTAVIGQGSSIELAALGPGTVLCDYMSYIFMFLSIATSNMVATSLARQIRALAWPALLVGWVAQSASLGMKDSWGPLKALAVASAVNGVGDIVLCIFLGYGIAGAAWATMVSQKGYNAFSISVPSPGELIQIFMLAAPVFITIASKILSAVLVAFYSLLVYFATSKGTHVVAAHQVLAQTFSMSAVWGEPLSQTAQSFMPELMYGVNRSLAKLDWEKYCFLLSIYTPMFGSANRPRTLLKSLLIIGASLGLVLGTVGTCIPWFFPQIFTPDPLMGKVLIPYFIALCITPCTHSCEGTLLAGRDLKFISLSMSGCFVWGFLLLLIARNRGWGLAGLWFALVGFQWARFFLALQRLLSPNGVLFSEDSGSYGIAKEIVLASFFRSLIRAKPRIDLCKVVYSQGFNGHCNSSTKLYSAWEKPEEKKRRLSHVRNKDQKLPSDLVRSIIFFGSRTWNGYCIYY
ncbi:multi antimicrobial extrusion (MATE) (TC 2.A.66.1) [Ancistrocladus abbreviatus]